MKLSLNFADCYSCMQATFFTLNNLFAAMLSLRPFPPEAERQPAGRTFSGQGGMF